MSAATPIRVLVIDDSAQSRRAIARVLEASPRIEIVGIARDGEDALRKAVALEPDLITLDLEMPGIDGFTLLRIVMQLRPTPILVISGRSAPGDVFKALELGAVDFLAKPSPRSPASGRRFESELLRKALAARDLRVARPAAPAPARAYSPRPAPPLVGAGAAAPLVVAIGASTGGPAALMRILGDFDRPPPVAFLVAQHMPEGFTRDFAARIDRSTVLAAREAAGGEALGAGLVWVAPGGHHLELEAAEGRVRTRVVPAASEDGCAPSVDRLFESAAKCCGPELLAVVLTGMGDDGRLGVGAVKAAGGAVLAESEETAVIHGMPAQAIRSGCVDRVLPLHAIAEAILRAAGARRAAAAREAGR